MDFPLTSLQKFPVYQSREDYELSTGKSCPAYDESVPVQRWLDPEAINVKERFITYPYTLQILREPGSNKKIFAIVPLVALTTECRRVNIPVTNPPAGTQPSGFPEIPCPLSRGLLVNEILVDATGLMMGGVAVHDITSGPSAYTMTDHDMIVAIYKQVVPDSADQKA